MRVARLAAATVLALLAGAGTAAADSITYVRDHDVWVADAQSWAVRQVTHDGTAADPYRSPAEDDHGVIVAGHGDEIVRLDQRGDVLSRFDPPPAVDSTGDTIDGPPQQIAVSPDGTRIAFVYASYTCPQGDVECGARQVLLYSYADRATPVATFGAQFDLRNPAWVDDDRILAFGGHFRQVNVDSPGGRDDDAAYWFDDAGNEDLGDGELSRQGDRLAEVRSYGDNTHIAVLSVAGGPGGSVSYACFTGKAQTLASPTWSPDGRSLAFADGDGVEVLPLPAVVPGGCPGATSSRVVLPGASEPDWSPAAYAPGAPVAPAPGPAPAPHPASALRVRVATARLASVLRAGLVVRVAAPGAGRVKARAALGRRTVGSATARVRAAGTRALRIHLSRAGARALRHRRTARLAVRVAFSPAGGRPARARAVVRLRR
jgi:WD40-like Beta Propeller Repeat